VIYRNHRTLKSYGGSAILMGNETYTDVTFTTTMDLDESDSLNINVSLELVSFDTEERKQIGYANLNVFNEYRVNSWLELIDNADAISGDVLEVIDVLDKAKDNEEIYGLIAVLDHVEIDEEYRNKGYCSELINKILEYLEYINVNYIGLIPARIYNDDVVQNDDKAINYYIQKGFKPISRRVGGKVVMGKSLL
jgi:GNAT superfamily N-acetyltransferase